MQTAEWDVDGPLPEALKRLQGRSLEAAIEHFRAVIETSPQDLDSYHLLYRLSQQADEPDRAWCVAGLLVAFGKASAAETAFYEEYQSPGVIETDVSLDTRLWQRMVLSKREDTRLSRVFAVIHEGVADVLPVQRLKEFGIRRDHDLVDLSEPTLLGQTIKAVSDVLGLERPPVYLHRDGHSLRVLPTSPPVLAVGPDMFQDIDEKQLAFVLGKCIDYFHPWHIMAALYDYRQLDLILMAASRVVHGGIPRYEKGGQLFSRLSDGGIDQVGILEREMAKRFSADQIDTLTWLLRSYGRTGQTPDPEAWDDAVELSANHVGLLVADDIDFVGRILTGEVSVLSQLSRVGKVEDFVRYVASDRYHELRELLGVNVLD